MGIDKKMQQAFETLMTQVLGDKTVVLPQHTEIEDSGGYINFQINSKNPHKTFAGVVTFDGNGKVKKVEIGSSPSLENMLKNVTKKLEDIYKKEPKMASQDIYSELFRNAGTLKDAEEVDFCGLDSVLSSEIVKLSSLGDLSEFYRTSKDTLVHKAEKDLWKIKENKKGEVIIQRLFEPDSNEPIKI